VAPVPHRGERNEPAHVIQVVRRMAEIRGVDLDVMKDQIYSNATKLYGNF
jgi:TatD DNase family protein